MELIVLVVAAALIGLMAQAWGVDSRADEVDVAHPTPVGLS